MNKKDLYFYGGMNTDDESRLLPEGDYRLGVNIRGDEAGSANQGAKVSIQGNLLEPNTDLDETQTVIGTCAWVERASIVYFVHSGDTEETPHSIWYFDTVDRTHTLVREDNVFNFQLENRIVHSNIVNNVIYWTDGYFEDYLENADGYVNYNPPRMLNLLTGSSYTGDFDLAYLDVIKAPYGKSPNVDLGENGSESNLLYGYVYQFAYQWIYEGGEKTVWTPISKVSVPKNWEFVQGRNFLEPQLENMFRCTVATGTEQVKRIRVAVRRGNNSEFTVFKDIDKDVDSILSNNTIFVEYDGTLTGETIPLSQGIRGFDRLPQVASTMEYLTGTRQLAYGNFVEDYDPIELGDTSVNYLTTEIPYQLYAVTYLKYAKLNNLTSSPLNISVSGSTANFGVVEGDTYVFEFTDASNENLFTVSYTITGEDAQTLNGIVSTTDKFIAFVNIVGEGISDALIAEGYANTFTPTATAAGNFVITFTSVSTNGVTVRNATLFMKKVLEKTLKTGVFHEFGIEYYDRAQRSGGVLTNDNLRLFVPFGVDEPQRFSFIDRNSPYYVRPYITGKHVPPTWARYYQPVYKRTIIADFQQRTGTQITNVPNTGLLKISLDSVYETQYGARINHTIQVGDIVRIVRAKGDAVEAGTTGEAPYAFGYIETQVQRYEEGGGLDGGEAIYVSLFDYQTVIAATNSFVVEIYSVRQESTSSVYYAIGDMQDILDPYTEDRRHGGQDYFGEVITSPSVGGDTFVVEGDARASIGLIGSPIFDITFTPNVGVDFTTTASAVVYNYATNQSTITVDTPSDGTSYATYQFNTGSASQGSNFVLYLNFGDVYLRPRATNNREVGNGFWRYWCEDPHQSDYYVSDSIDIGKPAIIQENQGRKELKASGIHGGSFIDNSNNNNLSSFDFNPLNKFDLDESFGEIRRMIMSGYTLKVLQDRKETSIYIQRTMAVGADGSQNVSYTDRTWGGINPYESLYGTIHPESVKLIEGQLFYYDYYSSKVIRSITNGQQPVSEGKYKMNTYFVNRTRQIQELEVQNFFIIANIDEQNREYQLYFKDTADGGTINEGVIFNLDEDRWSSTLSYVPTATGGLGNINVMFKEAQLYVSNEGANLNVFGEDIVSRIDYVFNDNFNLPKRPLTLGLRCYPMVTGIVLSTPEQGSYPAMRSTIPMSQVKVFENGYWVQNFRDELDPRYATEELARVNGRELRGYELRYSLTYSGETKWVLLSAATTYVPSPAIL